MTRRDLLAAAFATPFLRSAPAKLKIGVTDWNLRLGANPESIPLAAKLGFDGVQISFGRRLVDDKLPLDNPDAIARCLALSKEHKIPIDGTCVDKLHDDGLKSGGLAFRWVRDSIRLTQALGTQVLLLPFFGKWAIEQRSEMDYTAGALRALAPEAEKAGVILGLEDTISAEDNARILDMVGSKNVLVYYDVGNSTGKGFDPVKEIRWLGKDRICQIHLKDNPNYLGEGKILFAPIVQAIQEIGFTGYSNLETDAKSPATLDADMRRNLNYIRSLG
jgi:sugar phosphate isomerase/epimerase